MSLIWLDGTRFRARPPSEVSVPWEAPNRSYTSATISQSVPSRSCSLFLSVYLSTDFYIYNSPPPLSHSLSLSISLSLSLSLFSLSLSLSLYPSLSTLPFLYTNISKLKYTCIHTGTASQHSILFATTMLSDRSTKNLRPPQHHHFDKLKCLLWTGRWLDKPPRCAFRRSWHELVPTWKEKYQPWVNVIVHVWWKQSGGIVGTLCT